MILRVVLVAIALTLSPSGAMAAPTSNAPHLRGISASEAANLIKRVQDVQTRLKAGEKLYFELLSGAPASYEETRTSPREAFLAMPFEKTGWVEMISNENKLWQRHRLSIQEKPGGLLWDIEVVLGFNGNVERIAMFYRPPAAF